VPEGGGRYCFNRHQSRTGRSSLGIRETHNRKQERQCGLALEFPAQRAAAKVSTSLYAREHHGAMAEQKVDIEISFGKHVVQRGSTFPWNAKRGLARPLQEGGEAEVVEDGELPSQQEDNRRLQPVIHLRAEHGALRSSAREDDVQGKGDQQEQNARRLLHRLRGC